jgi:hypothetical protein
MSDLGMIGPTALALGLRRRRFSPPEAERLVALKLRFMRGGLRDVTHELKRLRFARWLVDHGRLDEGVDDLFAEEISDDDVARLDTDGGRE